MVAGKAKAFTPADEATGTLLSAVRDEGIETVYDRYAQQLPQCRFGTLGLCCRHCLLGPCRISPTGKGPSQGICGARDYTLVARHIDRMIAGGCAAHSSHGKGVAVVLGKLAQGKTPDFEIEDPAKLGEVATRLGLGLGMERVDKVAAALSAKALEDYTRLGDGPLAFLSSTVTKGRLERWDTHGVLPSNIEDTIVEVMHRTTMGVDADPVPILFSGVQCALADYTGAQISSDFTDVLFGTPRLVTSEANIGVLREEAINVALHGHNPLLANTLVDVAREMREEARKAGAAEFNLIGICCTGNELLMRKGIPIASNFLSQELVMLSGLLDAFVFDYQCIMPSMGPLSQCVHTRLITTEEVERLVGDTHLEFRPESARAVARRILELAIEAFEHRPPAKLHPPKISVKVTAGFSVEQIRELLAPLNPDDPFSVLVDYLRSGQLRGLALFAGCKNLHTAEDRDILEIAKELAKRDVLLMATGCNAVEFARAGYLDPRKADEMAGDGLKAFLHDLSRSAGIDGGLPFIWHLGSCVDNPRYVNLATEIANRMGVDIEDLPFVALAPEAMHEKAVAIGTWAVAMGFPVHVGTITYLYGSSLVTEVLENTARDVYGGYFIFEPSPTIAAKRLYSAIEYRRWKLGLSDPETELRAAYVPAPGKISQSRLFQMAIEGAIIATGYADVLLNRALEKYGQEHPVGFPETGYQLPSIHAWTGKDIKTLSDLPVILGGVRAKIVEELTLDNALAAGEATMVAAEIVEALKYLDTPTPYDGTLKCGFVPDRTLRQLGIAFVDDTIPGCAVFVGKAKDPKMLAAMIQDCQNKGMLIIATYDVIEQLRDQHIAMGLDRMLYPVGSFTQLIHGLNFAIRAALSFGGIKPGDRRGLYNYLSKRPKVFVVQLGPLDHIKVAAEFAVMFNGSPTITDQDVEEIAGKYVVQQNYAEIIATAIETREIHIKLGAVDIPVPYGPAFEGESIRRPEMYVEAGGPSRTVTFELLKLREASEIEDGRVTFIGKDVDEIPEGGSTPLGVLVEVYGPKMQPDFESVLERRIHQFTNFCSGAWHTGQRNLLWLRLSKESAARGLRLKHLGTILVTRMKQEFGAIVSRVQVTIMTEEAEIRKHLDEARKTYKERDARIAELTDEHVDTFYTCTLCQSFAPGHVCIVTPERLGLCGAINWLDAKASHQISATGPNSPVAKGAVLETTKGQWEGVNAAVSEKTHGKLGRLNIYTMMEHPMTSCGCFECIVAISADLQAVIIVNREHSGMTPIGMAFSTLAGSVGGGVQTPGFIGVGRNYLLSKKFIAADGGLLRIAWMPKDLKEAMREALTKRAEELGVQDFLSKVADETITTTPEGLVKWMQKMDHPALQMPPLMG